MNTKITLKINDQDVDYVRADSVQPAYIARKEGPWEIGQSYFIRTVTMAHHGVLVDVTPTELVLMGAAWIADTGRFHDFVTGKVKPSEVEPFPADKPVIIGRGALIDAVQLDAKFLVQM